MRLFSKLICDGGLVSLGSINNRASLDRSPSILLAKLSTSIDTALGNDRPLMICLPALSDILLFLRCKCVIELFRI